jgi:CelD/BcsL family acetyltransferase involved in cellulose biosynthesis
MMARKASSIILIIWPTHVRIEYKKGEKWYAVQYTFEKLDTLHWKLIKKNYEAYTVSPWNPTIIQYYNKEA